MKLPAINETTDWLCDLSSTVLSNINAYSYGYAIKGDAITGTLDPSGDVDFVRIPMAAEETYRISVTGSDVSFSLTDDGYLSVDKTILAVPGADGSITWTATHPSAHYYLIVSGSGAYTVSVDGVAADGLTDEAGNDITTTATLAANQSIGGVINGRNTAPDTDCFAVDLWAGSRYFWQMTPTNSVVGATAGGWLTLYDAEGIAVSTTYSASAWTDGASIDYTPTSGGRYYIAAATYGFNDSGSYVLSMGNVQTPTISVMTVQGTTVEEPGSASTTAIVTFTLDNASASTVTASYITINGSATGGADFVADSGSISFAPGETRADQFDNPQ